MIETLAERLRDGLAPSDAAGAYAVQAANTAFWIGEGRRIVGRKVGLTAQAVQRQLGVDQPDFGVLFADMEIADGGELRASQALQPKAEAEIALILSADIDDPDATPDRVAAAVASVAAAIEIVDSRIADWKITFSDTVADNGSSAFYVLGASPRSLDGIDLAACAMTLTVDGETKSSGSGAACLGHPLNAAAWLVRTLARQGELLRKGDVILTGALGPMITLTPGTRIEARIEGLGRAGFSYRDDRG